jgi:hypothetical protein
VSVVEAGEKLPQRACRRTRVVGRERIELTSGRLRRPQAAHDREHERGGVDRDLPAAEGRGLEQPAQSPPKPSKR